jgi:hypothetical protein|tara:strand:+ start:102 stop:1679 length:1578 start_codon:yes stop_codon:yes gene_type:complete
MKRFFHLLTIPILFYFNTILGQDIPQFQKDLLSSLRSVKIEIENVQSLIDKGEKHSINEKTKSPLGKLNLKLSDYSRIISDLENLQKIKGHYLGDEKNIELSLIREHNSKLLSKDFLSEYNKLNKTHLDYTIDRSFFSKNYFRPNNIYGNSQGYWVTHDGTKFYHAAENWSYWAPMGMTESIHEPTQDTYVRSEICSDATVRYSSEWNKYVSTNNEKSRLKYNVHELIKREIIPKIDVSYKTKRDSAVSALGYIKEISKVKESHFVEIIDKVRDSGVFIPENKEHDYDYIYNKVKTFGQAFEKLYQSHLAHKKEGNVLEAAYYLFNLVATDKRRTFKKGHENYLEFKNMYQDEIRDGIQLEFVNEGIFNAYCTTPLTNYDCLFLSSLVDDELMSKFFHHESNRNHLPKIYLTNEEIINFLNITGFEIPSLNELRQLSNFDNNSLENLYQHQLTQVKLDKMTTDNFGITGLFGGANLLLLDENGNPSVYRTKIQLTESWGMKAYSLQFEKTNKREKDFLNIRLKRR